MSRWVTDRNGYHGGIELTGAILGYVCDLGPGLRSSKTLPFVQAFTFPTLNKCLMPGLKPWRAAQRFQGLGMIDANKGLAFSGLRHFIGVFSDISTPSRYVEA